MKKKFFLMVFSISLSFANDAVIDNLYRSFDYQKACLGISSVYSMQAIIQSLDNLPKHASKETISAWIYNEYFSKKHSIYFRFPHLDAKGIDHLCQIACVEKPLLPTQIDIKYRELMRWKHKFKPSSSEFLLAEELEKRFEDAGSHGKWIPIKRWIRLEIEKKNYHHQTLSFLSQLADMEGFYLLQKTIGFLRDWQEVTMFDSPVYHATQKCIDEAETILLYGGDLDDFHCALIATYGHDESFYMHYPGISYEELCDLAIILQIDPPSKPTEIDRLYNDLWVLKDQIDPTDQPQLMAYLKQIKTIGSLATLDELPDLVGPVSKETASQLAKALPQDVEVTRQSQVCQIGPNTRMTLRHREGDGVGYNKGYTTAELFLTPSWDRKFQPFLNARGHIFNNGKWATNVGIGSRWQLWSSPWVVGTNIYYDWRNSKTALSPHQIGLGGELLNPYVDFRLNGYIPIGLTNKTVHGAFDHFEENFLFCRTDIAAALSTIQAEAGAYLPGWFRFFDMYAAIGPYYLFERNVSGVSLGNAWGVKARLSAQLYDGIKAEFDITYDEIFKTKPQGYLSFSLPLGPSNLRTEGSRWSRRYPNERCDENALLQRRMTQDVERNEIIPIQKGDTRFVAIDPRTGLPLFFVFVNNTSSSLGTFESPFPTTALAEANSKANDVIYVFPGDGTTTGYDTTLTLKNGQILQSATAEFNLGSVSVPPQSAGPKPKLTSGAGDAVVLANNTNVVGFQIQGAAADGINGSSAANFLVLNNTITGNMDNGLESTGAPGGVKQIIDNHFRGDNVAAAPLNSEILIDIAANSDVQVLSNIIDSQLQAAIGLSVPDINEGATLLASGNNIRNYIGGGLTDAGAAVIISSPTGPNPAQIFLTKNTLTGSTLGAYSVILSSGENIVQINNNGFSAQTFFHTVVFNNPTARTQLQTNNNTYNNPGIAFGQVTIESAGAGQLCHQIAGNNALPATGYLFINSTGVPGLYQVESPDGTAAGVATVNTGTVVFSGGAGLFTFVVPDTPCP